MSELASAPSLLQSLSQITNNLGELPWEAYWGWKVCPDRQQAGKMRKWTKR